MALKVCKKSIAVAVLALNIVNTPMNSMASKYVPDGENFIIYLVNEKTNPIESAIEVEPIPEIMPTGYKYYAEIPLSDDLQRFLYEQCQLADIEYSFALAVMEKESQFKASAKHTNGNGSVDRGIMQINSSNISKLKKLGYIKSAEDLLNPYIGIECGMYMLYECTKEYGCCEMAYTYYNSGKKGIKHTPASPEVMKLWEKWKGIVA